jgi:tetratricopeptide (TPR) repeat protein
MQGVGRADALLYFNEGMAEFVGHNYEKSIAALNQALEIVTENKIARLSRASAYMKLDRLEEAQTDFDRVIENHPEYAKAYHLRGLAHEKSGDNQAALKDFDRAIDLDPEYGAAYYSRANLHSNMGNEVFPCFSFFRRVKNLHVDPRWRMSIFRDNPL